MSDLFSSVNINSSFQRSARIDNKISSEFLDHFVFHDTSKKVLNQISSSLLNSNQSGFTLTGPYGCLLYTSPSPRDATLSRMPSSA